MSKDLVTCFALNYTFVAHTALLFMAGRAKRTETSIDKYTITESLEC